MHYTKTLSSIRKHPYRFILGILADFVLIAVSLVVFFFAYESLIPHLEVMVGSIGSTVQAEVDPVFFEHYNSAFIIISVFAASVFLLYIIIKGTNWKLFVLDRKGYPGYMLKFLGLNIIWAVLFYIILSIYLNFIFAAAASLNPVISINTGTIIFYIVSLIVIYFAAVSYITVQKGFWPGIKNAFVEGSAKARHLAPNFLIIFLAVAGMRFLIPRYPLMSALIILFLVLPMLAFNRIYMKETIKN